MKLLLKRHSIEDLFDMDAEPQDQAIVCLDKDVKELEEAYSLLYTWVKEYILTHDKLLIKLNRFVKKLG
jgi:hypothetical protein